LFGARRPTVSSQVKPAALEGLELRHRRARRGRHRERQEEVREILVRHAVETRRRHADDDELAGVDAHRAADDRGSAPNWRRQKPSESTCHGCGSDHPIVVGRERAAELGRHAEQLE
jgi:hypothetical protein